MDRRFHRACAPQFGTRRALLALAAFACTMAPPVHAEPITFRFNAEVIHALTNMPLDLPFEYQEGDVISGRLTFEPNTKVPLAPNVIRADQFLGLGFVINGTPIHSSTYSILVFDDTGITDAEINGPVDTMTVGCSPSSAQPCTPKFIDLPDSDPFAITATLNLIGEPTSIEASVLSPDPSVWNSFVLERSLALTFNDKFGGSQLLFAEVGQFIAVPEPRNSLIAVSIMLLWSAIRSRQNPYAKVQRCCRSL